jgi:hypothetical protein
MKIASLQYSRLTIVVLVLLVALGTWIPRQRLLNHARRQLADAQKQMAAAENRSTAANEALETSRRDLKAENSRRDQAAADLSVAEGALAKADPETRWATPPPTLPEWNAESPYVWLRKEMVPRFPVEAFNIDGALQPEIASVVLLIDPASVRALNEKLKQHLAEYRALEVAKAERSEEHLPGIANQPGEKLTIRVQPLPEEGARIKQEFETDLTQTLGEQRATLVKQVSENWLDTQFAQFGAEPKIISVLCRPSGDLSISIKTGSSWFSTGGPAAAVRVQIPPHFRPMFASFLESAVAKGSQ